MRNLFSELKRRATWRSVWLGLASAEAGMGLVRDEELESIRGSAGVKDVDVPRAHEVERKIRHDLMAELHVFAEQAREGGGRLHLGATSMDIEDNADVMIYRDALGLILTRLLGCLEAVTERVKRHRELVCMGWTHLQPAEPTTLGYRFANYGQDLSMDITFIGTLLRDYVWGKGIKGAVGTSASFMKLLGSAERTKELERGVMERLGLNYFEVSTQTYPRKLDYLVLTALASVAQSCAKFGLDLRVLQSPVFGELSEPIEEFQVGSSAMPFKKNPVTAERMCSLARVVSTTPLVAFMNASNSILERTLDDSASRRIVLPEAFLATDECLAIYERLVRGLRVYPEMLKKNLDRFGPFAGTEALMMRLAEKGMDRQKAHELLRVQSFVAWDDVMKGKPNPLDRLLVENTAIASLLSPEEIREDLDPSGHVGDAISRCDDFVERVAKPLLSKGEVEGRRRRPERRAKERPTVEF